MKNIKEIVTELINDDIKKLFVTIYSDVTKCEMLEDYCGIHHREGTTVYAMISSMLHPLLDEVLHDVKIERCDDVTTFCVDILKDAELIVIIGHDMSIKHLENSPDAIFRGVTYLEDNPNDEPEHPVLSSIIVLAENNSTVNSETRSHILSHELVHFMFEYMQKVLGFDEFISDIKSDNVLEELLCDMLPFYYLGDNKDIKTMVDEYVEYESKHIKTNVLDNRLKYIKELQSE